MMTKETRFQQCCPRKLEKYPTKPCPLAMQSMEAIRNGMPERAQCQYFVNNLDSNFCFFQYMEEECPTEGVDSNRKIGQQLMLTEKEVNESLKTAVDKLKNSGEDVELFAQILNEQSQYMDNSIYQQDSWFEEVTGKKPEDVPLESLEPGKPGRKKKLNIQPPKGHSGAGAVHKSGKIQLHSLSDNWYKHVKEFQAGPTPIKMAKNNMGKKKKDKDDEETTKKNS